MLNTVRGIYQRAGGAAKTAPTQRGRRCHWRDSPDQADRSPRSARRRLREHGPVVVTCISVLLQLGARECCECCFLGWGLQDVACSKVFGLWVRGAANAVGGSGEIVAGVPELSIGAEQEPIGAGLAERHADAASVHDSSRADHQ